MTTNFPSSTNSLAERACIVEPLRTIFLKVVLGLRLDQSQKATAVARATADRKLAASLS